MAEPQLGLQPVIPRFQPQAGPSPLIPVIILFIVGTLRWWLLKVIDVWNSSFEDDYYEWSSAIESVQSHFAITALLIPVCLLLAVQAFGIPQVNPVRNAPPPSPFVKAITQNMGASILLIFVILALLVSIPIRSVIHSPWQPSPPSSFTFTGSSQSRKGICQELAVLKKRCVHWKGSARNTVCKDLARLQVRCERGRF